MPDSKPLDDITCLLPREVLAVVREEISQALDRAGARLGIVEESANCRRQRRWRERQRALRETTAAATNGGADTREVPAPEAQEAHP